MGVRKKESLRTAFWKFLFMLLLGLLAGVVVPFGAMMLSVTGGIATYAN